MFRCASCVPSNDKGEQEMIAWILRLAYAIYIQRCRCNNEKVYPYDRWLNDKYGYWPQMRRTNGHDWF